MNPLERLKRHVTPIEVVSPDVNASVPREAPDFISDLEERINAGEIKPEEISQTPLVEVSGIFPYHQAKNIIEQEINKFGETLGDQQLGPINFSREGEASRIDFEIPDGTDMLNLIIGMVKTLGDVEASSYSPGFLFLEKKDGLRVFLRSMFASSNAYAVNFTTKKDLNSQEIEAIINVYKLANSITERQDSPKDVLESMGATIFDAKDAPSWDYIAGYDKAKRQVRETVIFPLQHPEIYEQIARKTRKKHESNRPKAVLFEGPPGTGKTTMARLIAGEVDATLVYVPIESIMSKWYGEAERNLAKIFNACKRLGNSLLFLDEIDSLATARDGNTHEATRKILSVLLREIDGFNPNEKTILIGATNRKSDLDPALLSRFNISIEFPLPDLSERQAIFGNYAMHLSQAELEILSQKTADLSGRGIKNLCERVERSFASEMIAAGKEEVEVPTLANYLAELE